VIRVRGSLVVPAEAEPVDAALLRIEVRDAALADAPAPLVAARVWTGVAVRPGAALPFAIDVPDLAPGAVPSLQVHVDVLGTGAVRAGDLLSTAFHPIPTTGEAVDLVVPLTVIS
jgi:hypothetical protein